MKAVLLAPVAEVVVVLELSDVRDVVGEAVEPRPSVSWLGLWEIGDMTEVAGSSTAPPNGWMIWWLAAEVGAGEWPREALALSAAARFSIALRRSRGL